MPYLPAYLPNGVRSPCLDGAKEDASGLSVVTCFHQPEQRIGILLRFHLLPEVSSQPQNPLYVVLLQIYGFAAITLFYFCESQCCAQAVLDLSAVHAFMATVFEVFQLLFDK